MGPLVKIFLRRELRLAKSSNDEERSSLIEFAIRDNDIIDLISNAVRSEMEYGGHVSSGSVSERLSSALAYMIQHREEILKIIFLISQGLL